MQTVKQIVYSSLDQKRRSVDFIDALMVKGYKYFLNRIHQASRSAYTKRSIWLCGIYFDLENITYTTFLLY